MRRCTLCGERDDGLSSSDRCSYDGPWHEWGEPESTDPRDKIKALRAALVNSSARPWHFRIKDRMSSAVATVYTPPTNEGVQIMCSQPIRYRKGGDGVLVTLAVNNLDNLVAIAEAALKECGKFRFPDEDRPELWDALQRLGWA